MAELVSIKRNVDVSPGQAAPAVFHCSQGDVGSKIILGLLNNGTAYSIPSGVTVTIEGSESNGSIFTPISATASGSDITFYLTGEMTAVAGPAICQAVLKSGSNILGTANFTLEVESSPMGADAPPVFTDAGWTWMLNKLTTEFVPALGNETIIDAIDGKADQSDLTALSNTVAGHTGSITVLNNTVNTLNRDVTENRQNIAATGDALGKVKDATTLFNAVEKANFTENSFYNIGAVGSTVESAPSSSSAGLSCAEFTCSAGDVFQVALLGGGSTAGGGRAYGFLDSNRAVLVRANRALNLDGEILVAPENAAYLVVNSFVPTSASAISERYAIKGNRLSSVILDNTSDISTLKTTAAKARVNNKTSIPDGVTSANNLANNTIVFVSVISGGSPTITDTPFAPCWIETIAASSSISLQIAYPYGSFNTNKPQFRVKKSGTFGDWQEWGKVQTFTYSVEKSNDHYENTYNITTTPNITTDDNGWLNAVDTDTADETNKTDMTGAIMSMLTDTGYCHLGPGIFYVSGNIDMPRYSTLEGCGESTVIRLLQSTQSGYIARVCQNNQISNIRFSGGRADIDHTSDVIGTRIGIAYLGNADGSGSVSYPAATSCNISNCSFENFSNAAIYCYNTGGTVYQALKVVQCYIRRCIVGINIDYNSEYHKFESVVTYRCHWGCINNGGNNVFVGCTFGGVNGFTIDNSQSDKANNGHGSCIGCTFNHIEGRGILLINCDHGFVFDGCQNFYAPIEIVNCQGIIFANSLLGGNTNYPPRIYQTGDTYPVFFMGCLFTNAPTKQGDNIRFINCYLNNGTAVTA